MIIGFFLGIIKATFVSLGSNLISSISDSTFSFGFSKGLKILIDNFCSISSVVKFGFLIGSIFLSSELALVKLIEIIEINTTKYNKFLNIIFYYMNLQCML